MMRPSHFTRLIDAHSGVKVLNATLGRIHFKTDYAHVKEWPSIFKANRNITIRPPESYKVHRSEPDVYAKLAVHNFPMGYKWVGNDKLLFQVYFDSNLQGWLSFIQSQEKIREAAQFQFPAR